ncbi:hypothetical protein JCM12825_21910 [Desulfurobacterium crinifex]
MCMVIPDFLLYLLMVVLTLSLAFMALVLSDTIKLPFDRDSFDNKERTEGKYSPASRECSKLHTQKTTV